MRKVAFGVANSLDNYIARKDEAVDWLLWGDEARAVMADFWKGIDAIVMGRKTYDVARRLAPSGGNAGPYGAMATYLVSRTLRPADAGPGVELVDGDPVAFLSDLKNGLRLPDVPGSWRRRRRMTRGSPTGPGRR